MWIAFDTGSPISLAEVGIADLKSAMGSTLAGDTGIYLLTQSKSGILAMDLKRQMGVSCDTA